MQGDHGGWVVHTHKVRNTSERVKEPGGEDLGRCSQEECMLFTLCALVVFHCLSLSLFYSDEDWEPEVSRGRIRRQEDRGGDEEEEDSTSASTRTPSRGRATARGRGRGRTRGQRGGRGRGQRGGRGRGHGSAVAEEEDGAWLDEDTEDILPPQPTFRPSRKPGPQLLQGAMYTALQLFRLFMTDDMLRTLLQNTNTFGAMHHTVKWTDITLPDLFSLHFGTTVPALHCFI